MKKRWFNRVESFAKRFLERMYGNGYRWHKTSGNGLFDFLGIHDDKSGVLYPRLAVEVKRRGDRVRASQKRWASEQGCLFHKFVLYFPDNGGKCYLYPFDEYLLFERCRGILPHSDRKNFRRKQTQVGPTPSTPIVEKVINPVSTSLGVWQAELQRIADEHPGALRQLIGKVRCLYPTVEALKKGRPRSWKKHFVLDEIVISTNFGDRDKDRLLLRIRSLLGIA